MGTRHWTQSYADIPAEIDADRYASMVDLLDAALERHASRPAFKAFGQTLNYADVDRLSRSFASYLQNKLGVRQGDRVAVMMPNLLAFPVTLLGIMRAGAVQGRAYHLLHLLAIRAVIVQGPPHPTRPGELLFAPFGPWIPDPLHLAPDEAVARWVEAYFRNHYRLRG